MSTANKETRQLDLLRCTFAGRVVVVVAMCPQPSAGGNLQCETRLESRGSFPPIWQLSCPSRRPGSDPQSMVR
ncbi:unnamed protein product [Cylicostephanus goldi]|uniref:Uncharacterized protein n=1 Tax=Cylicostephanus goldi TaxID=71465 RepID=A0A3P6QPN8_CYLGO|nr:unnamed protein product [Cylicostephanus goldi]